MDASSPTFQTAGSGSAMATLGKDFSLQHSQLIRTDLLQHFIPALR